jgi:hypothetical protein
MVGNAKENPLIHSVSMGLFLKHYASAIEMSLISFKVDHPEIESLSKTEDPHSLNGSNRAIHDIRDEALNHYGIQRSGGFITLRGPEGQQDWDNHSFLSDNQTGELVIEPTPGVFSLAMGTTLDTWIAAHPELFYKRILFSDKQTIANTFGVIYPSTNKTFEEYFGIHTNR